MKTERQVRQNPMRYWGGLIVVLLILFSAGAAKAEDGDRIQFANVVNGSTISELGVLRGTVDFPDFLKYEVFLKSGDNLIWSGNSYSPVIDGNLVRIDPRVFNSGDYELVIRAVHTDSNYTDYPGPRIKIHNPLGSALPYYPEVEPSFLYPSPKYGVVRVRNCAGEDFNFDYRSPDGGKSADDTFLKGKSGESICTFEDLTLIPGRYQGSGQGGAQDHSFGFDLQIEAGRVYEILYIGPNNTGPEFSAGEVAADDPMGTPMMKSERMPQSGPGQMGEMGGPGQMGGEMGGPGQMGGPNPNNEQMGPNPNQQMGQNPNQQMGPNPNQQMGPDKGMDQKADGPKAKPESMLPETGESQDWNMPGIAMGSILILILGIGGVVALRRRPTLKEANGRAGSNHSAEPPE